MIIYDPPYRRWSKISIATSWGAKLLRKAYFLARSDNLRLRVHDITFRVKLKHSDFSEYGWR